MTEELEIKKLNHDVTMEVQLIQTTEFKLRVWLAGLFIWLAAQALGCDVEINANG